VLVRQTIRAVSASFGFQASFAPSVVAGAVGNGGHVHLSVWRDGQNLLAGGPGRHGLSDDGEAFAGGILAALPALTAVGAPSVASYLRLVPSHWAGAYHCWGLENREAALRLVTGSAGEQDVRANLEVKCFDLAANPYLAAGSVIAAGLAGLDAGEPRFAVTAGDSTVTVTFHEGFGYAQVYAPPAHDYICFEPMTAPTDALRSGEGLSVVEPGGEYRTRWSVTVTP